MRERDSKPTMPRVLLVSPKVPPYGGMAVQAGIMERRMTEDAVTIAFLAANLPFPKRLHFLERTRLIRPFLRSIFFSCELWKMLGRADVVHILACSWLFFFLIVCPAVILSRIRGKRIILNYHGGEAAAFFRWYRLFIRPIFWMADVVTAPSQFLVDVISKQIGVPVQIVPNIASLAMFRYRERVPLRPRMLVTRHLLKLYDVESVLRAFGEVQRRYPEASLRIVGTGDQESRLRGLVSSWRLENVDFLGYVAHRDLPAVYDQCDILLNASRADNFPGSLIEAAAAGLVVISTGVGGIPYIFEDGKTALLVKPGDWAGLAAGALRVIEDPDLALRLSREAFQECRRYDWTNVRRLLYRIYGFHDEFVKALDLKEDSAAAGCVGGRSRSSGAS